MSYNADDRTATIKGAYDQSESITLDDMDFDVAHAIERSIRSMEKAAYHKALMDLKSHTSQFNPEF